MFGSTKRELERLRKENESLKSQNITVGAALLKRIRECEEYKEKLQEYKIKEYKWDKYQEALKRAIKDIPVIPLSTPPKEKIPFYHPMYTWPNYQQQPYKPVITSNKTQ